MTIPTLEFSSETFKLKKKRAREINRERGREGK